MTGFVRHGLLVPCLLSGSGCDQLWAPDGVGGEYVFIEAGIEETTGSDQIHLPFRPNFLGIVWFAPGQHPALRETAPTAPPPVATELQFRLGSDYRLLDFGLVHPPGRELLSPWSEVAGLVNLPAFDDVAGGYDDYGCSVGSPLLMNGEIKKDSPATQPFVPVVPPDPDLPISDGLTILAHSRSLLLFCRDLDSTDGSAMFVSILSNNQPSLQAEREQCLKNAENDWRRCEADFQAALGAGYRATNTGLHDSITGTIDTLLLPDFVAGVSPDTIPVTDAYRLACPTVTLPPAPNNACHDGDKIDLLCSADNSYAVWQHRPPHSWADLMNCRIHPPIHCQAEAGKSAHFPAGCGS